uniref:ODF3A protein n=1 Tax=Dromaius novaehollandiae TaxID=8790 RepID=A0A8C4J648_DRONO
MGTEHAWVGTWKPHRPRGPVMAQFTSPGPKYSIPGTTGKSMVKSAKNRFQIPTRSLPVPPAGPDAYTVPRVMGPNTAYTAASPCYSMKWRSKLGLCEEDLCKTPGPAAYRKTELDVYKTRAPKYTIGTHSKPIEDEAVKPGPADYYIGKPQAPAVSFGIRHSKYTTPLILDT